MVILCTQNTCEHWRYPPSKVEFYRNILSQNISVKSYLILTEHQTCTVFEGEGGGGSVEIWHDVRRLIWAFVGFKFDKYTNLIRWFKFCMCLQEVKRTIVLLWERERKKCFVFYIFIFIFLFLFYLTRQWLFTRQCFVIVARTCIADYVILSSIFFSRR